MDRLLDKLELYKHALLIVAALLGALLLWWIVRSDDGRNEIDNKIVEIKTTSETAERRADAIVDAAKKREEAAKHETERELSAVSDDALPAVLSGLLAEYRGTGK